MNVLGIASLLFGVAVCDLNVAKTKECGQLRCGYVEFCSPIDNSCKHCSKICDEGHNQEIFMCNEHCQDYIHEMRFVRRGENLLGYGGGSSSSDSSTKEQIEKLQVLSTISLIISLIVFACLVFLILTLWANNKTKFNIFKLSSKVKKRREKPDITRKDDLHQINGTEISTIKVQDDKAASGLHELNEVIHNDPRTPQMDLSTLTTTFKNYHARSEPDSSSSVYTNKSTKPVQPLGVRLPSEDSTLDFMYDNPALAPSPTMEKENSNQSDKGSQGEGKKPSGYDT